MENDIQKICWTENKDIYKMSLLQISVKICQGVSEHILCHLTYIENYMWLIKQNNSDIFYCTLFQFLKTFTVLLFGLHFIHNRDIAGHNHIVCSQGKPDWSMDNMFNMKTISSWKNGKISAICGTYKGCWYITTSGAHQDINVHWATIDQTNLRPHFQCHQCSKSFTYS